jgi:simple sugar transport system permease protein
MRRRFGLIPRSHEAWLLAIILVLCVALAALTRNFLTLRNLVDLLTTNATTGIFGAGLLVVLISGGIDISFTATASVAQYVALTIANRYQVGWTGLFATVIVVGTLCGAVNGVLIYRFRIKSVIVSIATLNIMFGLLIWFTNGVYITDLPDWFQNGIDWLDISNSSGDTFYINLQMVLLVVAFASTTILLYFTNIGRQIFAMGGNPEAAQRLAFNVFGLVVLVYVYMGVMAGLASLAQAQLAQSVIPSSLVGKELDVVAAVVLGGASLLGGKGSVLGTLLGLALLAILQNGLTLIGVSSYWLQFFVGCLILGAVILTAVESRRSHVVQRSLI